MGNPISWRKWKVGMTVAAIFGLLTAGAGLVAGMTWKAFAAVLCTSLITNFKAYLMVHPVDDIIDTTIIVKKSNENSPSNS